MGGGLDFLINILIEIFAETTTKVLAFIITALISPVIFVYLRRLWRWITTSQRNTAKLKRAREAVTNQAGLWLAIPLKDSDKIKNAAPNGYDVTTVANLKGGVGKTTLAANLIGHCAKKKTNPGQSVLGIDFDYQGSMTSMSLPDENQYTTDGADTRAGKLISGGLMADNFETAGIPHATEPRAKFIPSDYPFAQVENRQMIQWLLNDIEIDLRLRLTNLFTDLFRSNSSIGKIIIDAPPRLTTGAMQALCASSRIIIPTVMDRLSTDAVGRFVEQIYDLRRHNLCPYLTEIWVVGTIINRQGNVDRDEHLFLSQAMQEYSDLVTVIPFELCVPDRTELSRQAGHQIAYLDPRQNQHLDEIRGIFDRLGDQIWRS